MTKSGAAAGTQTERTTVRRQKQGWKRITNETISEREKSGYMKLHNSSCMKSWGLLKSGTLVSCLKHFMKYSLVRFALKTIFFSLFDQQDMILIYCSKLFMIIFRGMLHYNGFAKGHGRDYGGSSWHHYRSAQPWSMTWQSNTLPSSMPPSQAMHLSSEKHDTFFSTFAAAANFQRAYLVLF